MLKEKSIMTDDDDDDKEDNSTVVALTVSDYDNGQ